MDIVTECGFWKDIHDKHYCSETIKCLFKSLADLDKIDTSIKSGEINFVDYWYYKWNIINNEIHISNVYWKK